MAGMFPTNKEISVFGKKIKFPGVTDKGEYTNGNFENPDEPPSYLDADTQNLILHNLNNLIAQLSGKEANNTDRNQLAALFTVAATALRGVQRDAGGRAKVAAPVEDDDIARKKEVDDVGYELGLHLVDTSNPHKVTKAQVGLGNVDNTADKDKTVKSAGTCTGNAATAGKWQTACKLNGLSIQGDADRTNYAVCSTAAGTQAKTCACAGFALVTGAEITVKFSATNTQNDPTLNVNGTGAKAIYYRGAAIPLKHLHHIRIVGCKQLPVGGPWYIHRIYLRKHGGNGICQILIDIAFPASLHIHIDYHDTILCEMFLYQRKELNRGHLKRDGNVLIGIYHNHIISLINGIQICPSIIGCYRNLGVQRKKFGGKLRNLFIDFNTFHRYTRQITHALACIGPGTHSQYQDVQVLSGIHPLTHKRGRHGIVIIHPRQIGVLQIDGLHTKQYIGGQNHLILVLLYLQIILPPLQPFRKRTP